jgi:hypothetical protein
VFPAADAPREGMNSLAILVRTGSGWEARALPAATLSSAIAMVGGDSPLIIASRWLDAGAGRFEHAIVPIPLHDDTEARPPLRTRAQSRATHVAALLSDSTLHVAWADSGGTHHAAFHAGSWQREATLAGGGSEVELVRTAEGGMVSFTLVPGPDRSVLHAHRLDVRAAPSYLGSVDVPFSRHFAAVADGPDVVVIGWVQTGFSVVTALIRSRVVCGS